MTEQHDTLIIGGGQAGLAMSFYLQKAGVEHLILERARIGERWRSERWDSLRFQFPNWSVHLPGRSHISGDPDGFCHHTGITRFIEDYSRQIDAPVRENTAVTVLWQVSETGGYIAETPSGAIAARRVVIATGPFQRPFIPDFSKNLPSTIYQVDATDYRSPDQLPPGAVLVVGSGASGCQIADELYHSGRTVYLSVSRHRRVPRRYRGKDMMWWFEKMGRFDVTIDAFPGRKYPPSTVVTGMNGGYDLDVRRFAAAGVKILGHVQGIGEGSLALAIDANQVLAEADKSYVDFISAAGKLVSSLDLESALEAEDSRSPAPNPLEIDPLQAINLKNANIESVIWATGHRFDFNWVKLPVIGADGAPLQRRGVTTCPGVYFLGLHWMHTFKSGLLSFVGEDAAYLAEHFEAKDK